MPNMNANGNILICGASGFVGKSLIPALLQERYTVSVLGRDKSKLQKTFRHDVTYYTWDELNTIAPDEFTAVINLAGENIAAGRWTKNNKLKIVNSRVETTSKIVAWCLRAKFNKPHLYNTSAIGVYGLQPAQEILPPPLRETDALPFTSKPTSFLREVGQAWEGATLSAHQANYPLTLLRFAVVLKRGEGMLQKLALPFSLGLGAVLGQGKQAVTWIHIEDLVAGILFLLKHPAIQGPVNLCSPTCVDQKTFAATLAQVMHRPLFFTTPAFVVNMLFGQMGAELLLGGQNIYPQRLQENGFCFKYADLHAALMREWPEK